MSKWLENAVARASQTYYGKPAVYMVRADRFRSWECLAQSSRRPEFLITGVLGPKSNAHGPNEFLHTGYAKKLTACIASIISDHAATRAG
jgi:hypothetical protein